MTLESPSGISNDKGASANIVIPGPAASAANGVALTFWHKGDITDFADFRGVASISPSSPNRFAVVATLNSGNRVFELSILKTGGYGLGRSQSLQSLVGSGWNLFGLYMPPGTGCRYNVNGSVRGNSFSNLSGDGVEDDTTHAFYFLRNVTTTGRRCPIARWVDVCLWQNIPTNDDFDALMAELATPVDPTLITEDAVLLHRWMLTTDLARTGGIDIGESDGSMVLDTGGTTLIFHDDDDDLPDHLSLGSPEIRLRVLDENRASGSTVTLPDVFANLKYQFTVQIHNDGDSTLNISDFEVSGPDAASITVVIGPGATVLSGQSTTVTLEALYTVFTDINFTIAVTSNDSETPSYTLDFDGSVDAIVPVAPPVLSGWDLLEPNPFGIVVAPWNAKVLTNFPAWYPPMASVTPDPTMNPKTAAEAVITAWTARGYGTRWKNGIIMIKDPNSVSRFNWSPSSPNSGDVNAQIDTKDTNYWFRAFFSHLPEMSVGAVIFNVEGYSIFSLGGWTARFAWAAEANLGTVAEMISRVGVDLSTAANDSTNRERLASFCFQRLKEASRDSMIVPLLERFPNAVYYNYNDQQHRDIPFSNIGDPFPYPQGALNLVDEVSSTNLYARITSPYTAEKAITSMNSQIESAELSNDKGPNAPWFGYFGYAKVNGEDEYHPDDLREHWIGMFEEVVAFSKTLSGNVWITLWNPQGTIDGNPPREPDHRTLDLLNEIIRPNQSHLTSKSRSSSEIIRIRISDLFLADHIEEVM